jgi:RNA polymerase sigma-70 factor (ECF subfamily)
MTSAGVEATAKLPDLVERARQGDHEALSLLCRQEWTTVYRVIAAAVPRRDDAEELTQEVFVRALGHLGGYQSAEGSFRPYLVTVARNLLRDRWRAQRRAPMAVTGLPEIPSREPGPEATAVADIERAALVAELARLPADYQKVLRLRLLERRPTAEVAEILGRRPDAVRQLQRRALVALRAELGRRVEGGENRG